MKKKLLLAFSIVLVLSSSVFAFSNKSNTYESSVLDLSKKSENFTELTGLDTSMGWTWAWSTDKAGWLAWE